MKKLLLLPPSSTLSPPQCRMKVRIPIVVYITLCEATFFAVPGEGKGECLLEVIMRKKHESFTDQLQDRDKSMSPCLRRG